MRILFLTQICPYPPSNGGAIKTYNILKHLGSKHDVDLLTFVRGGESKSLAHLAQYCKSVDSCLITRSGARNACDAARSLIAQKSFVITRDWLPEMHAKVLKALDTKPDLIYVDHLQMFQYVPSPAPCRVLLDEHNVEWRIIERFSSAGTPLAQRAFAALEWPKLRAYELAACKRADMVLTVTAEDAIILAPKRRAIG